MSFQIINKDWNICVLESSLVCSCLVVGEYCGVTLSTAQKLIRASKSLARDMTACRCSPALFVDLNQAIASTASNVHNVRSCFYTDTRALQIVAEPAPKTRKMKVKIRTWNAVATWRWDLDEDDVCGICQVHFDGTCPTCKYPGDDCSLRMPLRFLMLEWRN